MRRKSRRRSITSVFCPWLDPSLPLYRSADQLTCYHSLPPLPPQSVSLLPVPPSSSRFTRSALCLRSPPACCSVMERPAQCAVRRPIHAAPCAVCARARWARPGAWQALCPHLCFIALVSLPSQVLSPILSLPPVRFCLSSWDLVRRGFRRLPGLPTPKSLAPSLVTLVVHILSRSDDSWKPFSPC